MMKLEISGLSFSYGERQVLEDISFGVAEGEFVSLLGPSGCGKSTVLKLLTGILSPDRGRILVDGEEIRGLSSHFAYMPQNDLLFPWKTILDNVCLYGRIHGSLEEMRERAREYFPVFGLEGYEDSYPASLSGEHFFKVYSTEVTQTTDSDCIQTIYIDDFRIREYGTTSQADTFHPDFICLEISFLYNHFYSVRKGQSSCSKDVVF
mgnify:CR=1 FL=1